MPSTKTLCALVSELAIVMNFLNESFVVSPYNLKQLRYNKKSTEQNRLQKKKKNLDQDSF